MLDVLNECVNQSVIATFSAICGEDPELLESTDDTGKCDGIVGVISFVGDLAWTATLGFDREMAEAIALAFAGFEIEFDSEDMANVLAGDLVARFEAEGVEIEMSLPSIARGSDVEILLPGRLEYKMQNFGSLNGTFWLQTVTAKTSKLSPKKNN